MRWRYHKATHTHCIAFRKTAAVAPHDNSRSLDVQLARAKIWIPADGKANRV
jgi:hypothetical protein